MKTHSIFLAASLLVATSSTVYARSASPDNPGKPVAIAQKEPGANTMEIPTQILKTGINLNSPGLSPNTFQLATNIGLTPVLEEIQAKRTLVSTAGGTTLESVAARQDLVEAKQRAFLAIQRCSLEVDWVVSEIAAEVEVYQEVCSTFTADRDKAIARTNATSFISNGALWAVCEALAIPGYKNARFAIPSGIVGIPAGVVPSIASMYTFMQINGKKRTSEVEPNMLAKLFDYPTNSEIEYPRSVWTFLNETPADSSKGKSRKDLLIDRWIADANMSSFTDRNSRKQLDVLTASVQQKKGLNIGTLTARTVMLEQLAAEISKMKRMLLEMAMVIEGDKQVTAYQDTPRKNGPLIGARDLVPDLNLE